MLVYLIIALLLAIAAAGAFWWRLQKAGQLLEAVLREREEYKRDHAIQKNLEKILRNRGAEMRRLRGRVRQLEEELAALDRQASDLNLSLFHESGLRILHEKEEGANRMKLESLEKQLDEANEALKRQRADAEAEQTRMAAIIAEQQQRIDALTRRQSHGEKMDNGQ
ncbi:MAG: hypothetical protein ACSW8J_01100 [bacterium]